MTKKDYELFASKIFTGSAGKPVDYVKGVVSLACDVFEADNPLFNREKFEEACYTGKYIRKSIKGGR